MWLCILPVVNVSHGNASGVAGGNTVTVRVGGKKATPAPPPPRPPPPDTAVAGVGAPLPAIPLPGSTAEVNAATTTLGTQSPLPQLPAINSDTPVAPSHPNVRSRKNIGNGAAVLVLGGDSPIEGPGSQNGTPNTTPNGPTAIGRSSSSTPTVTPAAGPPALQPGAHPVLPTSNAVVNGQLPTSAVSSASSSPVAKSTVSAVIPRPATRHHRTHKNKRNSGK